MAGQAAERATGCPGCITILEVSEFGWSRLVPILLVAFGQWEILGDVIEIILSYYFISRFFPPSFLTGKNNRWCM